jgi:hypothetical protein
MRPARRAAVSSEWLPAEQVDPAPPQAGPLLASLGTAATRGGPPDDRAQIALEDLMLGDWLGHGSPGGRGGPPAPASRTQVPAAAEATSAPEAAPPAAPPPAAARVRVELVWGDIAVVPGDIYAVGHYQGVLPQRAELALDHAVSGERTDASRADPR